MIVHRNALTVLEAASKAGDQRYGLQTVHLKPDGTTAATDGHILAVYRPDHADDCDDGQPLPEPILIPAGVAKQLYRMTGKRNPDLILPTPNGKVRATQVGPNACPTDTEFQPIEARFPNYDNVIPESGFTGSARFDPALFARLCKIATRCGCKSVKVEFSDPNKPAKLTGETDNGGTVQLVIMPMVD